MIRFLLHIYILIIIVDVVLSYFPSMVSYPWVKQLSRIAQFSQKPVRRLLPPDLPIDPSPLLVIIGIQLMMVLW